MSLLEAPVGHEAIVATFGDPYAAMGDDGRLSVDEERAWCTRMVHVPLPAPIKLSFGKAGQRATRLYVHSLVADKFASVFRTLYSDHELWRHVRTFGGCYAFRPKSSGGALSTHSWGIAIDLNVATNQRGTAGDMHAGIVQAFEAHGFTWGGRWRGRYVDPMHFQFARGY